ncbi:hypothetical protein BX604_2790 [Burkholderia sp. JKS000303]|nr:hypothetical protein BX604_2790 [Burkholderia sp. JKS000303]
MTHAGVAGAGLSAADAGTSRVTMQVSATKAAACMRRVDIRGRCGSASLLLHRFFM